MVFQERLKILVDESQLTYKEFGNLFNVAESTVSLYLAGKRTPDDNTKLKICKYFNVSISWLMGESQFRNEKDIIKAHKDDVIETIAKNNIKNCIVIDELANPESVDIDKLKKAIELGLFKKV